MTLSIQSDMRSTGGVRAAEAYDEEDFLRLWKAMLEEIELTGSDILPTPENLTEYLGYFRAYQRGQLFGTCIVWESPEGLIDAITMAGEPWSRNPIQSRYGNMAVWWGIYLTPEYRGQGHDFNDENATDVNFSLWRLQRSILRDMGFNSMETFLQPTAWNHDMERTLKSERNRSTTVEGLVPGSIFVHDRQCINLRQIWVFAKDDETEESSKEDS